MKLGEIVYYENKEYSKMSHWKLCYKHEKPEKFHQQFFPHQKFIPHIQQFKTKKEAEQARKELNLNKPKQ
tara:strand:+ start:5279 stop:5488 length:210 start_codon:yes stop_codon:yes gene_type:complete